MTMTSIALMDALEAARRIDPSISLPSSNTRNCITGIRALDRAEAETTTRVRARRIHLGIVTSRRPSSRKSAVFVGKVPEAHLVEIAKGSFHRFHESSDGDLLVLYGLEMNTSGRDFLAAVFFASYHWFLGRTAPALS